MKLFALGTIVTLQLCFLRASALEELNVEDQDMEMDMDLAREVEEYDGDDLDVEFEEDYYKIDSDSRDVKARPSKFPFCERTNRDGWGGRCLDLTPPFTTDPLLASISGCDFLYNSGGDPSSLCRNTSLSCCVDCYAQKQYDNCGTLDNLSWPTRRKCCEGDLVLKPMDSGCNCCGKCIPSRRYCTKRGGFCVTNHDPYYNFDYCNELGGTLYARRCEGRHCQCCIPP